MESAQVEPLEGGITNRNYRVGPYVVRVGGKNTEKLSIDRVVEENVATWAAGQGIGAEVVFCSPTQDLMVTRFIEGSPLLVSDESLRSVARLLREVHKGPRLAATFSPFQVVRDYHARALSLGVTFPDLSEAFARMKFLEKALGDFVPCCCHNDLLAANFLHDGTRWRLLDWEYAAMGDPSFDLGNFAVNQGLNEAACRVLLAEYFGSVTPAMLARLEQMRQASDLREAFWGFLQSGLSAIDFDFRGYGETHLQRFLAADRVQI